MGLGSKICISLQRRRFRFAFDGNIDNPVLLHNRHWADFLRAIDTEAAAPDHRRATHADGRVCSRDDRITATEDNGVAGETAARHDANHRGVAAELAPQVKGGVQIGGKLDIGVAGAPAATFGKKDNRQSPCFRDTEQTVFF